MSTRVEVTEKPPSAATPDYCDAFAVTRDPVGSRSAETWVRAAFDGVPPPLRRGLPVAWGTATAAEHG